VNLVQSVLETLLFFHPAVWWLSSRLRAERELCCDDTAVALCGDRTVYARALATLEGLREHAPADLRIGANGGSLMNRIRRLLQPQLAPNPRFRSAALALAAAGLLAGTVVQQPTPKTPAPSKGNHSFNVDSDGAVTLNPESSEPVKVGKGGSFKLKETVGGVTRSYEAEGAGSPVYKVNGVQTPMDDAGRAWLKRAVKQTQRDEARGARMNADRARMQADREQMRAERMRMEIPEVTTEEKDGKQHIIVRKLGKVVSDDVVDTPDVSMTDEGPGRKHLIVKRDGRIIEDRIIEIPEVTTDEKDGQMHIVVKKGGKVTEDRVIVMRPQERMRRPLSPEQHAQMEKLQAQMEDLRRQMRELERQTGSMREEREIIETPEAPEPPEAPEAPEAPDAPDTAPPPPPQPPPPPPAPPAPPK